MPIDRQVVLGPTRRPLADRERVDWHYHPHHQLIYPSEGVLQVSTAAGAWVVPPHRAVFIPAGVAHAHRAHGATQMRSLQFDPLPLFDEDQEGDVGQPRVLVVEPLLREVIIALTRDGTVINATATESTVAAGPLPQPHPQPRSTASLRLLEQVALDELRRARPLALHLPSPTDDRLQAITRILLANPADPRTLAELGTAVGASERTLSRLFRSQTTMTFPQWRAALRLHHSVKLLAADRSVTAVATACGYSSTSAFIEAFRRTFGTTPGNYRDPSE
jgi:AraC-like DNA-binding protein